MVRCFFFESSSHVMLSTSLRDGMLSSLAKCRNFSLCAVVAVLSINEARSLRELALYTEFLENLHRLGVDDRS